MENSYSKVAIRSANVACAMSKLDEISTWMYLPETYNPNKYPPWDPGDGGWWNVFQFKAHDDDDVSEPVFTLSIGHNDQTKEMSFYLYSPLNPPHSFAQAHPIPLPVNRWFHIEARYDPNLEKKGSIAVWQDGKPILDVKNIRTIVSSNHAYVVWGIGNYTDHIASSAVEGKATVYFDDAVVSTQRLSTYLSHANETVETTLPSNPSRNK